MMRISTTERMKTRAVKVRLAAVPALAVLLVSAEAANVLLNADYEVNGVPGQMSSALTNTAHWIIFGTGEIGWY